VLVNADLRPDVRERYQTGAWPVMAWLLPNGQPLLSQVNDKGLAKPITTSEVSVDTLALLLHEGLVYWRKWKGSLIEAGQRWTDDEGPADPERGLAEVSSSETMARWLLGNADRVEGGFGAAPKFLVTGLDEYAALRAARELPAVRGHSRVTLERLVDSPLFDGRAGGMHRLAGAHSFGQIQYEKMLTGNATLMRELVWSLRGEESSELRVALSKTAAFVTTTLGRPGGGFFLAQVADPGSDDGGGYWRGSRTGPAPPIDRIVLSGANAMAGAALLRAGAWLDDDGLVQAGLAALDLVYERAYRPGRGAQHAIEPRGRAGVFLGAQVDVALGFLDGYESTGERRLLDAARDIVDFVRSNLKDPLATIYLDRLSGRSPVGLLANPRHPLKPNMRMARAMRRLELHGLGESYREETLALLAYFTGDLSLYGVHGVEAALALEELAREPLRIRISGKPKAARELRRAAVNSPWPWTVVLSGPEEGRAVAAVSWGESKREVSDPSRLHETIRELVGEGGS